MIETVQRSVTVTKLQDVMVAMRDGVRLATDVYLPDDGPVGQNTFSTILGRTSYDKSSLWGWMDSTVKPFTAQGYAVVIQDIRARYKSEGDEYHHSANPLEGPDGYDTIEWIAAQPWSNGRVGMVGSSHNAIVQQVAALHAPPHLTSIWPDVGPTNIYAHMSREGGAMAFQMFGAIFMHAYQQAHAPASHKAAVLHAMKNMRQWVQQTPFKPGHTALALFPDLEETLFNYYRRGAYDDWWKLECCDQERYWDRHGDIAATYSGGWFDPFSAATTRYYTTMAARNRTLQRLVMGPWSHDGMRKDSGIEGDVDFGSDSIWGLDRYNEERFRWFDSILNGASLGVDTEPPVRIFVMGGGDGHKTAEGHLFHGGTWRYENEWPLARAKQVTHYFHADGTLDQTPPVETDRHISFMYDPEHPVPSVGGNVASFFEIIEPANVETGGAQYIPWYTLMHNIVPPGPFHQKEEPGMVGARAPYLELASRADVLVFQTAPLAKPIEVTGSVVVKLWISSSAPDTDFTAKLIDVYPPSTDYPAGYHLALIDTILRVRYRNSWEQEELMEPGRVYPIQIALPPTSNLFKVGNRIRIDISSSNFPRFDLNPNTGEPMGRHTFTQTARNSVWVDSSRPSHAVLPVIAGANP